MKLIGVKKIYLFFLKKFLSIGCLNLLISMDVLLMKLEVCLVLFRWFKDLVGSIVVKFCIK